MNLNKIKTTAIAGMLAASMLLPNMTAFAANDLVGNTTTPVIQKTVTTATDVTELPANTTVKFQVEQVDNKSGNKAPKTIMSAAEERTITIADLKDPSKNVVNILTEDETGELTEVGEYTFKITETETTSTSDFGWSDTNTSKNEYYLRVVVKADKNILYFITSDYSVGDSSTKKDNANFTNTYNKKSVDGDGKENTLTVEKKLAEGDEAYVNLDQLYPVEVVITVPDTQTVLTDNAYTATVEGSTEATALTRTPATDGKSVTITANLKAGEKIVISNLAVDATYTVKETKTDYDNFVGVKYLVNTEDASKGATSVNETFENASEKVIVLNDFNNITFTGVVTDIAPYVTLVVVAVAAIAAYVVMKRRVAR